MSEFVFLFRGDEMSGSPDQMQKQMQRWGEWMKDLTAKGHFKACDLRRQLVTYTIWICALLNIVGMLQLTRTS